MEAQLIKNYVNGSFNEAEFNNPNDLIAKAAFISIFNSSFDYWGNSDSNLKSVNISDDTWVLINDGIGGILGSAFGPIGSIILGTAFSIGTVEEL